MKALVKIECDVSKQTVDGYEIVIGGETFFVRPDRVEFIEALASGLRDRMLKRLSSGAWIDKSALFIGTQYVDREVRESTTCQMVDDGLIEVRFSQPERGRPRTEYRLRP